MSDSYYISDPHLSHKNVIKMSDRPFDSIEEMDEVLMTNIFDIPKGSNLYILGDLAWKQSIALEFMKRKPYGITMHLIVGNHDHRMGKVIHHKAWDSVAMQKVVKVGEHHLTLSHHPMMTWYRSHVATSFNLYGHLHNNTPRITPVGKMLNMNCEFWDYKPVAFDTILEEMKNMPENWEIAEIEKRNKNDKKTSKC